MANTIKVETAKLRSAASNFSSLNGQIGNLINHMISEIQQINGAVWTGDAASAYNKKFNDLNASIKKIDKLIQEYVSDLNEIATEYDKAESQNRQTADSLQNAVF